MSVPSLKTLLCAVTVFITPFAFASEENPSPEQRISVAGSQASIPGAWRQYRDYSFIFVVSVSLPAVEILISRKTVTTFYLDSLNNFFIGTPAFA